jgi:hypothetical protein
MRKTLIGLAVVPVLLLPAAVRAQQQNPAPQTPAQNSAPANSTANGGSMGSSVADAARKAKEQKADGQAPAKSPRVFDNDNIPTTGGISAVGSAHNGASDDSAKASDGADNGGDASAKPGAALSGKDEKGWRELFKNLQHRLDQDQEEADLDQRELGVDNVQFYTDPVKGMQQGLTRSDINDKTAKIEATKKKIEADKQAISDAEEQLRAAGGDPGWAR